MAADDPAAAIFHIRCAGFNRVEKLGSLGLQRYSCSVLTSALPRVPEVPRAKFVVERDESDYVTLIRESLLRGDGVRNPIEAIVLVAGSASSFPESMMLRITCPPGYGVLAGATLLHTICDLREAHRFSPVFVHLSVLFGDLPPILKCEWP